jgi:uncharacterized membrane protein
MATTPERAVEARPVVVENRKGVTGGVFMGMVHFFITLPIVLGVVLVVSCAACVAMFGR